MPALTGGRVEHPHGVVGGGGSNELDGPGECDGVPVAAVGLGTVDAAPLELGDGVVAVRDGFAERDGLIERVGVTEWVGVVVDLPVAGAVGTGAGRTSRYRARKPRNNTMRIAVDLRTCPCRKVSGMRRMLSSRGWVRRWPGRPRR